MSSSKTENSIVLEMMGKIFQETLLTHTFFIQSIVEHSNVMGLLSGASLERLNCGQCGSILLGEMV